MEVVTISHGYKQINDLGLDLSLISFLFMTAYFSGKSAADVNFLEGICERMCPSSVLQFISPPESDFTLKSD